MSKEKQKNFWYVLVLATNGPAYITKLEYSPKQAYWNKDEKPLELSKDSAQQIALGLAWNGYNAVAICNPYEITSQPYNYKQYEIEWKEKEHDTTSNELK